MTIAAPALAEGVSRSSALRAVFIGLNVLVFTALFYAGFALIVGKAAILGSIMLAIAVSFGVVFSMKRFYTQRFILPGIVAVLVFIVFPICYTVYIGFTNFSSFNLLTEERVRAIQLSKKVTDDSTRRAFQLLSNGPDYQIYLPGTPTGYMSAPFSEKSGPTTLLATPSASPAQAALPMRDVVKLRGTLGDLTLVLPDGTSLTNAGLRVFAAQKPEFTEVDGGILVSNITGDRFRPDDQTGFYVNETSGEAITPGWRTFVGWQNFERIFRSEGIRAPMVSIFIWTCAFAFLSVLITFVIGLALAAVLQSPYIRFKTAYRILLILPYAVPAFISILVFRGLFNQNFGEINMILDALFAIRPHWFTDGLLARTMLVIVNVWLGYPYMMLLAMGFLQSVPGDHKKAATLEGAGSFLIFRKITLPQIVPPFLPLLVASFAFNFNNIVIVLLLTRGLPDIPGTVIPAGETDILGSFTYRIAFQNAGQEFGLAGAITLIIFLIVAILSYANFAALRRQTEKGPTT